MKDRTESIDRTVSDEEFPPLPPFFLGGGLLSKLLLLTCQKTQLGFSDPSLSLRLIVYFDPSVIDHGCPPRRCCRSLG